jgi:ADP-ribose pyrophosphatase YjhB (NUDIX family)
MYRQPVRAYPNRQYVTGRQQKPGTFLSASIYAEALDALVICCADAAILHQGLWLIARRAWEPHPDWWVIGGRMRKGELIEQALRRNIRRELHLDIAEDRLLTIFGYYSQIWDTRAWEPTTNGCHMFSITTAVHLTDEEKASIHLNEEYADSQWVDPVQVIESADHFHPCLVQIAWDIRRRFNDGFRSELY